MSTIPNTRGNPQASDVAVQTATPMLGGASREDLQTVISSADSELAKLFEDRNVTLHKGGLITYTGTAVQFTETLELHINSQVAGGSPTVISLGSSTRTVSASGRMIYAVINRLAGTAVVTDDAASLSAVTSANQEVYLIAKRVDDASGTKRLYFRNGSVFNEGQTAKLGAGGSGSGSGEINVIANTSDSTNWVATGTATVVTSTTAGDLPLSGVVSTAIKIAAGAAADYVRYRWTMPASLKNRKLKVEWHQRPDSYTSGDFKVEVYKNSASDYTGSYTEFSLSTDVSGTSSIPAGDDKYSSSFDADTGDYYELRIVRVTGSSTLNITNVIVGPGIQPQGAVVQTPQSLVVTFDGLGTVSNNEATYTRYGGRMRVQGRVTTGTVTATNSAINLPSGFTLNTGSAGLSTNASGQLVGYAKRIVTSATAEDQVPAVFAVFFDGTLTSKLFISERTQSGAFVKRLANDQFATGDAFEFDFDVPVAEWAGNATVALAQNDVEYTTNTSTATGASDTTSFGYGSGGVNFVAVSSAGSTIKKRVRAQRPMGAMAGKPVLEVSPDGILWMQAEGQFPYMEASTERYGMRLVAGGTALTDIDVEFGGDGANGTEAWSAYTSWKWRVTIQQPGVAVGFGLATSTSAGLMSSAAQTFSGAKTFNDQLNFGPSAGLGTGAAAYNFVYGSLVGKNSSAATRWSLGTPDGMNIAANIYKDGAGTDKAIQTAVGKTQFNLFKTTASGSTAFSFIVNYQDSQTADAATVNTNDLIVASATAAGAWTFGSSGAGPAAYHVMHGGNGFGLAVKAPSTAPTTAYLSVWGSQSADASIGGVEFINQNGGTLALGYITMERSGANNSGTMKFETRNAGVAVASGSIAKDGTWTFGPSNTPTSHRFQTNNGKGLVVVGNTGLAGGLFANEADLMTLAANATASDTQSNAARMSWSMIMDSRGTTDRTMSFIACPAGGNPSDATNRKLRIQYDGQIEMNITNWGSSATQDIGFSTTTGLGFLQKFTSSQRYKHDIAPLSFDSALILQLTAKQFKWNANNETDFGFIAEEVAAILPDAVTYMTDSNGLVLDENDEPIPDAVRYRQLVAVVIEELKKLRTEFDDYKASHP